MPMLGNILRALRNACFRNDRGVFRSTAIGCAVIAASLLFEGAVFGQTVTILVNGQSNASNQFFLPFETTATVSITSSIPDPVIFFTTDGSDVEFGSPIYAGPFTVTNSMEVQAFATDQNFDEASPAVIAEIQFAPNCTVTDLTPGGGTVSMNPPGGVYASNAVVTLTANPAPGWTFSNWGGGGSGTNPVLNVTLTNNLAIEAVFVTTVAMSALPENYGSVVADPPGGLYPYGTTVVVSAVANSGFYFFRWANTNFGAVNPITIAVTNANINCSAFFNALTWTVTDLTPGGGAVSFNPPGGVYGTGSEVTLTANPSSGWTFSNWSGGVSGTNPILNVTVSNNLSIEAVFVTTVAMSALPANYGSVVGSPPGGVYPYGTAVLVSAVPNSGFYFLRWVNTNYGANNPITIATTNANPNCSAIFDPLTGGNVSLTLLANGSGTVSANPALAFYPSNSTVTITATPGQGDAFTGWSGNASGAQNPLTLTLTNSLTIAANFSPMPPSIVVQPQSTNVLVGTSAALSVTAVGGLPLSFQWQFNGTNLAGAMSSALDFADLSTNQTGNYDVVISNIYGVVTSQVAKVTAWNFTIQWTGGGDGVSWTDTNNWNTGVLPTSSDSIFIGSGTNTITGLSLGTLNNLICQRPIAINSSLTATGAVQISQGIYTSYHGVAITASGTNASFVDAGVSDLNGIFLYAQQGAFMEFPSLITLEGGGGFGQPNMTIEAESGAVLNLSSVRSITGPFGNPYTMPYLAIRAEAGALVNLSGATNINGGSAAGVDLYAEGSNGVINLSSLLTFTLPGRMQSDNGGMILASNLNYIQEIDLYVDSSSTLQLTGLKTIDGGGGFGQGNVTIEAGPGAVLNLSSVTYIIGPIQNTYSTISLSVIADVGALINLSGVTNIECNGQPYGVYFYADATNSVINLTNVQSFTGPGLMSQANGGVVLFNSNAVYQGVSFQFAPEILAQPQSVGVFPGSNATISVLVDGDAPLSYQWYCYQAFHWFLIQTNVLAEATNATLSLTNVSFAEVGSYAVIAANAYGSATSAVVTLGLQGPPVIMLQPQSQTLPAGTTASVAVIANGSGPLTYQWFANGVSVLNATNATLTLANVSTNQNGIYDVVISNSYGAVTSQVASLTVSNTIQWTISWSGAGDGFSWNDPRNWSRGVVPGSSDSILIGPGSGTITNQGGMTLSNMSCQRSLALTGSLTVTGLVEVDAVSNLYLAPGITLTVSGTNASFTGEATTTADGVNMYAQQGGAIHLPGLESYTSLSGSTLSAGGTGSLIDLPDLQTIRGPDTDNVFLNIVASGGARINMSGVTVIYGSAWGGSTGWYRGTQISASGSGSEVDLSSLQTFTWWDAEGYGADSADGAWSSMSEANGGQILVPNLSYADSVSLSVAGGGTFSLPALTNYTSGIGLGYPSGRPLFISASGTGSLMSMPNLQTILGPSFTWVGLNVSANAGAVVNMVEVTNINGRGGGVNFNATASNSVINLTSLLTYSGPGNLSQSDGGLIETNGGTAFEGVSMDFAPAILSQPQGVTVFYGANVTFSVSADGSPPLSYQWYFNGNPLAAATNATLSYSGVAASQGGGYTVVITNTFGSITSAVAFLELDEPPTILAQPQSTNAVAGNPVALIVTAVGGLPMSFQWQWNGTNLPGATASTLAFPNLSTNQNGIYDVVISNSYGVVTSQIAKVTALNITIQWTGGGDGVSWTDPNNWNTGVVPTSSDSILIGPGAGTITNVPSMTLSNMICQRAFALTGNLTVTGAVEVTPTLSLSAGISITASGTNAWLLAQGAGSALGVNFSALQGALISFPWLTNINNPIVSGTENLTAGSGGLLDLSSVQQMSAIDHYSGIIVAPQAGGVVDLSGLTNISSGYVYIEATATNCVVNLANLQTFAAFDGKLDAENGGAIWATNLSTIQGVSLYVDASSTLALGNLATIGNPYWFNTVSLTAYSGAVLDLSTVQWMSAINGYSGIVVTADEGALINFSGFTNISSGYVYFYANSPNSVINLSGLLTFIATGTLSQGDGGVIQTNGGTVYEGVSLDFGPAIIAQPQGATVFIGANVTFSASADGSSPLSYQWVLNRTNIIAGATNATLAYPGVTYSEAGSYTVVVTNAYGAMTSAVAVLQVAQPLAVAVLGRGTVGVSPITNSFAFGQTFTLTATPANSWYAFVDWSDGNTNNPRTVTLTTSNNLYTAIFTNIVPMELHVLEQWEQDFGGTNDDYGVSVQQTTDGGYIMGGTSSSPPSGNKYATNYGGYDYWVVKMDAFGNKQWERTFGGSGDDELQCLQQTADGGYVLGGQSDSGPSGNKSSPNYGGYDFWVVRLDSNGNKLWDQSYGGSGDDYLMSLQQNADGGFILGGYSDSAPSGNKTAPNYGNYDFWIVRLDANGNKVWDQSYGGSSFDEERAIQQTEDGGFILAGCSVSGASGNKSSPLQSQQDGWVVKIDGSGNKQWDNDFIASSYSGFGSLQQTDDGGFILGGGSGNGYNDDVLLRLDPNGNKLWGFLYGGAGVGDDEAESVVTAQEGGFILGGFASSGPSGNKTAPNYGGYDYWVVKTDVNGNKLWDQSYGGTGDDYCYRIQRTTDGGLILAGYSDSQASGTKTTPNYGGNDFWVVKISNVELPAGAPVIFANGFFAQSNHLQIAFTNSAQISITSSIPNAHIYFTLDGTAPSRQSLLYGGPFAVNHSLVLQAFAMDSGETFQTVTLTNYVDFVPNYTLTDATPGGGTVSFDPPLSSGPYLSNSVVTLSATAAPGWAFANWSGDATGTNPVTTVTLNTNKTIAAVFVTSFIATPLPPTAGTVVKNPSAPLYAYGQTVILGAEPAPGSYFLQWSAGNYGGSSQVAWVVTNADAVMNAQFGTLPAGDFSLTLLENGAGTVTPFPASDFFTAGTTIELTAAPTFTNYFTGWSGDASGTANPLVLNITSNETITANFASVPANDSALTLLVNGNGSVSANPPGNFYTNGSVVSLTPIPAPGYAFAGWGGATGGTNNPLSVTISSNTAITANFIANYTFITLAGDGAGRADGIGNAARFWYLGGVAVDSAGNIYVADQGNTTIRKVTPAGVVTTLAGAALAYGCVDGTGSAARFCNPWGVAVDSAGNIYVGDEDNDTIRKVTPVGVVTTLAGLAYTNGSADGTGSAAQFSAPTGVGVDSSGNVYVADNGNNTIRQVTPTGVVTTLAGMPGVSGSADGTGSNARFNSPYGIAVDSAGNIYVADEGNNTIRKVTPGGVVTTLAGLPGNSGSTDGTGRSARFNSPYGIAVDSAGNLYVGDCKNSTIRQVTPAGVVTTVAGMAGNPGWMDGTGSGARFNGPIGVAVDSTGNLYVADGNNFAIRKGIPAYGQPIIIEQPQSQAVLVGSNVTITANIAGTGLIYQWQLNGVAMPGQTNTTLNLPNAQTNAGGNYNLVISNALGCVTSAVAALSVSYPYTFVTLAGQAGVSGGADGTGSAARFNGPKGVVLDSAGNVYVADISNDTIRKVTPAGVVTTLAGLAGVSGSADGTGSAARFGNPWGVALDSAGNVYVADTGNDTIREVASGGVVTTLAGRPGAYAFADGTGSAAGFYLPTGVAVDSAGNVYVADQWNNTIRQVTPGGVVTTLAGMPGVGGSADGTGSAALFWNPEDVALDSAGNLYVSDSGNETIRKMTPAGVVTTLAGFPGAYSSTDGVGAAASFWGPQGVAVDSAGNVYVADQLDEDIRKVTPAGVVTTLAGLAYTTGSADGTGSAARFNNPGGVAVDSAGNLYVADTANNTIRKGIPNYGQPIIYDQPQSQSTFTGSNVTITANIAGSGLSYQWQLNGVAVSGQTNAALSLPNVATNAAGSYTLVVSNTLGVATSSVALLNITYPYVFTTLAGVAGVSGCADGMGSAARFYGPEAVAVDSAGSVFVADAGNYTIRQVSVVGLVTTLAGLPGVSGSADGTGCAARFNNATGVAVDSAGNLYAADQGNETIRKVTMGGAVTTLAGQVGVSGSADGTGSAAQFLYPNDLATDAAGNVYVADYGDSTIRKVTPAGVVTTLAGLAGSPGSVDGTGSAARLNQPLGVAVDGAGNVYVADQGNNTIRKVTPAGGVTTLAGMPGTSGSADGAGTTARFNRPYDVAVDSAGNIYVADEWNDTIRKVTPAGVVTTLAGLAGSSGTADGAGSAARFYYPTGLAVDGSGNIYVADCNNETIRKGIPNYGQPIVVEPPQSAGTFVGSNVTLTANVIGNAPLAYQWQLNGIAVSGQTNAALSLPNVATNAAGSYTLVVSNSLGIATSQVAVLSVSYPYTFITLAGMPGIAGCADGTGSAARFNDPQALTIDTVGNLYVADFSNSTIRKLTASGVVTTLAGMPGSSGSADGTASAARFNQPFGVAVGSAGNIYVSDAANSTIREISPVGVVTTLAGLAGNNGSTDGTGSAARFNGPAGMALDNKGNIYVADSDSTIRKVTPEGVATTLAGISGNLGSADGTGSAAQFIFPMCGGVDSAGNVYIADEANSTIRKMTSSGVVTTLAGLAGNSGSADGTGSAARFNRAQGVAIDSMGNLYVADTFNSIVRKMTPTAVVTTVGGRTGSPGSADGTGSASQFNYLSSIAVDSAGNLYVGDSYNNTIRKGIPNYGQPIVVEPPQSTTAYAGSNVTLTANIVGNAPLSYQWQFNGINLAGQTGAALNLTNAQTNASGNYSVVVSNSLGLATSQVAVLNVSYPYTFITIAGLAGHSGVVDGTGSVARFVAPQGVAVDSADNLYVVDNNPDVIREVTSAGVVTTVVGSPFSFGSTDGTGT